jgi:hypothetical protein
MIIFIKTERDEVNVAHITIFEGVYDFKANLIEGELPHKQRKLVEAWAATP